jgi:protein involved in sex pheromone biosynthesis
MKKILGLAIIAGVFSLSACGPSAEEKAAAEKAVQDSIAAAEAQLQAAEEAARAQAVQDSLNAAAAAAADTTAAHAQ